MSSVRDNRCGTGAATLVAAILGLASPQEGRTADIYRWVDADGVVHFSDRQPRDGATATLLVVPDRNPPAYDPAAPPAVAPDQGPRAPATPGGEQGGPPAVAPPASAVRSSHRPWNGLWPPHHQGFPPVILPPPSNPSLAAAQWKALEQSGLTGARPASINSRAHGERVERSRSLPLLETP